MFKRSIPLVMLVGFALLVAGPIEANAQLGATSSFKFEPATIPFNPDFNRKSLRGNIVLRWEYLRGSTIFFVWNMSTVDRTRPGEFSPLQDFGSAFRADGTHVFMIKLNYWLGL